MEWKEVREVHGSGTVGKSPGSVDWGDGPPEEEGGRGPGEVDGDSVERTTSTL